MGECFLHGMRGGGSAASESGVGLNILYGGERPQTAEPDTIWVSTESASGVYVLSPNTPEGEEGMVWFQTGDSGLSVTMQNPVKAVFLLMNAFVYLDGKWTFMAEAGIYKDGAWILFCEAYLKLYDAGDQCTDVTGGFYYPSNFIDTYTNDEVEFRDDCVYFQSRPGRHQLLCPKNRILLDRFSKVVVDWYVPQTSSTNDSESLSLTVTDWSQKNALANLNYGPVSVRRKDTLDISNVTGECFIAVRSRVTSSTSSAARHMQGYVYSLELRV